jgi:hypothetical protein
MVDAYRMLIGGAWVESEAGAPSGTRRVGGRFSMERLTQLKTIVRNLG